MDNLRAVINNLFCHISPEEILSGNTRYDNVSEETFMQLGRGYIRNYSVDELKNMYSFLENEFLWNRLKMQDQVASKDAGTEQVFHVFDALTVFNNEVLIEENGEPKCQYTQLLRWREMIVDLEEDLFITSFLAYRDSLAARYREDFFWKPVIGHNNKALNTILAQGIAENHFHLKGSAPHFHLSWISLMNQVDNAAFQSRFEEYESERLEENLTYNVRYGYKSLSHMWRQAVLIRIFLFSVLRKSYLPLPKYCCTVKELWMECKEAERERICQVFDDSKRIVSLDEVRERLLQMAEKRGEPKERWQLQNETVRDVKRRCSERYVFMLLRDEEKLKDASGEIQHMICSLRDEQGSNILDYTLCESFLMENRKSHLNEILSGERWFLYSIFREIYVKACNSQRSEGRNMALYYNWFYLYLVLKTSIRKELVQANQNVGFTNFELYQDRKDVFVEGTPYEKAYIKMAVRDTIYNQNIRSLEARFIPKKTVQENYNIIQKYDRYITEGMDVEEAEMLRKKYFYVMHFIKTEERWKNEHSEYARNCRHLKKRNEVREQAMAIAGLRESGSAEAARIKGIDAASLELWCRPEVFAQAFRFLKNHTVDEVSRRYAEETCPQLRATYHAGEDFLDIVDGLRAIDEAILFLNLQCGDRLGHALALGVDVDDWYKRKMSRIVINKQGYLDNLAWLYAKIRRYHIKDGFNAAAYIEKQFDEYFKEVYSDNIHPEQIKMILKDARKYYEGTSQEYSYHHENLIFNINVYYDAWKLRGDDPELYERGFFRLRDHKSDEWEEYAVNKKHPLNYRSRYNPETALLYYMYHYEPRVKVVGDQMIEVKVNPVIKDAVKQIAAAMCQEISNLGIGIETNPSSNYLIGTFRRYDRHPIMKWYNLGLTIDPEELQSCPQIQVSINTDDQGIFATYLENEYAYLALALEKSVDAQGRRIYNRTMILQWLDNIRKMGIAQSFAVEQMP